MAHRAWGLGGLLGPMCSAMALAGPGPSAPPGLFIQVIVWPRLQDPPPRAPSTGPSGQPPEAQGHAAAPQGPPDIYAPLTEQLAAENEEVRAAAVVPLANMGGEQAVAAVISALHAQEPWVRGVVEALAVMGGDPAK